jgi:hypothetical protein
MPFRGRLQSVQQQQANSPDEIAANRLTAGGSLRNPTVARFHA